MPAITAARIKRTVRKIELEDGSGATGYTVLKFRSCPLERLVKNHDIGPEELWAADDIDLAWSAISGALAIRSPCSEKVDRGISDYTSPRIIDATSRYRAFATHWAKRRGWGDRTFEVLIAAIIDQRSFDDIEIDLGLYRGKAKQVTIGALRDYAARAHMVPPQQAQDWMNRAAKMFRVKHPALRLALLQAKNI